MDELEKLRKHWQDDDFQRKHALAREIVVNRLRELNREYEEKNRTGICTFYRNTDEDAGEHCREAATQGL